MNIATHSGRETNQVIVKRINFNSIEFEQTQLHPEPRVLYIVYAHRITYYIL